MYDLLAMLLPLVCCLYLLLVIVGFSFVCVSCCRWFCGLVVGAVICVLDVVVGALC